jgi:hypothetical protein
LKGRAHKLFEEFRQHAAESGNSFAVCRVILLARVIPERVTPELDDPDLEGRLEEAIGVVLDKPIY